VDDPYEPPIDPELTLDTVNNMAEQNAEQIIAFLEKAGLLLKDGTEQSISPD
jgi:adenylylsulfate kinase-like enzyme